MLLAVALLVGTGTIAGPLHAAGVQSLPDVGFMPIAGPPFDAPDVWVDSPLNGFDTYFAGLGPSGVPVGSGDPLWPGRVHQVYARVHNFGGSTVRNLTLHFYIRQPAVIGDSGFWQLIGTLDRFGPIRPGAFRDGFVEWVPRVDMPTSIKVEIEPLDGELSTANNTISERSAFVASSQSLTGQQDLVLSIENPTDSSVDMFFEASITPQKPSKDGSSSAQQAGWRVVLDPESRRVRPGCGCLLHVSLYPPSPCEVADGAPAEISILGFFQRLGGPRLPLGGLTMLARAAKPADAQITCRATLQGRIRISGQLFERDCTTFADVTGMGAHQPFALEYRSPSGEVTTRVVTTKADGGFFDTFTRHEPGSWSVQGNWIGDRTHLYAESAPCSVEVVCPAPELEITMLGDPVTGDTTVVIEQDETLDLSLSVDNARASCQYSFSISPQVRFVTLIDNGDGTGTLRLAPDSDLDPPDTYTLTVTVTDNSSPPKSASQTVTIEVTLNT